MFNRLMLQNSLHLMHVKSRITILYIFPVDLSTNFYIYVHTYIIICVWLFIFLPSENKHYPICVIYTIVLYNGITLENLFPFTNQCYKNFHFLSFEWFITRLTHLFSFLQVLTVFSKWPHFFSVLYVTAACVTKSIIVVKWYIYIFF